jgi:ribosomal protein L30/L7E
MTLKRMDVDNINMRSPFSISYPLDPSNILESVGRLGIINPPVLLETRRGGVHEIVIGARRIAAASAAGIKEINCLVLPEGSASRLTCLLAGLYDNLSTRKLNPIEKAIALRRLRDHLTAEEVAAKYMTELELPCNQRVLDMYLTMECSLSETMKLSLAKGGLSLKAAEQLIEMGLRDREKIFNTMELLGLNHNYQIQFIELLDDISKRDGTGIAQVLERQDLSEILSSPRLSVPQKAKKTMELLRDIRNPSLASARERFKEILKSLKLEPADTIIAPSFFEVPHLELRMTFANRDELQSKVKRLCSSKALDHLFEAWNT